jgi:hypothetical protein
MNELRFTLLSDGSSDRALLPILRWLLIDFGVVLPINDTWADLRTLPKPPQELHDRIKVALKLYPCDLLFVHRDAEKEHPTQRIKEIREALDTVRDCPPAVCVVPVRMQEAWLLFNERAIRQAAGNPNSRVKLDLPPLKTAENITDPKLTLHTALKAASGLKGRRLASFRPEVHAHRVATLIDDFSPLKTLPAFQRLAQDMQPLLDGTAWQQPAE